MTAEIVVAILLLYQNGKLADLSMIGATESMARCEELAPKAIEAGTKNLSKNIEAVIKCVSIASVEVSASGFGKATSL